MVSYFGALVEYELWTTSMLSRPFSLPSRAPLPFSLRSTCAFYVPFYGCGWGHRGWSWPFRSHLHRTRIPDHPSLVLSSPSAQRGRCSADVPTRNSVLPPRQPALPPALRQQDRVMRVSGANDHKHEGNEPSSPVPALRIRAVVLSGQLKLLFFPTAAVK